MSFATSLESIEIDRLRAHFELVGVLLGAQRVVGEGEAFVAARERTLGLIEAYAERGRFPRNEVDATRMLPSFVDSSGTTCAVAFLMEETEARPLVERIRRRFNASYVGEMLGSFGAAIGAWAASVGLRQQEVGLIQPDYCSMEDTECVTYYSNAPGEDPPCRAETRRDGAACCVGEPGSSECPNAEGTCQSGDCILDQGGCAVAKEALESGSLLPSLAALILLAAQRRAFRVRVRGAARR